MNKMLFNALVGGGVVLFAISLLASAEAQAPIAPVPPVIEAGEIFSTNIEITWSEIEGAVTYTVYRNGTVAGDTADTSLIDYDLAPDTEYTYHAISRNSLAQTSADSNTLELSTTSAPDSFSATAPTYTSDQTAIEDDSFSIQKYVSRDDRITVSFVPKQAGDYLVYHDDTIILVAVSNSQIGTHRGPTLTIGYGFDGNVVIFFRDGADLVEVARAHVTTGPAPPPTLTVERLDDNSIKLSWDNVQTVSGWFGIYINDVSDGNQLHETLNSPYTITGEDLDLVNDATRIGVTGSTGSIRINSDFVDQYNGPVVWRSVPAQNAEPPATPALVLGEVTDTSIALSWGAVDNADSYTLTRIVAGGNVVVVSSNVLTATDETLSPDTPYKYTITATNTAGTSTSLEFDARTLTQADTPAIEADSFVITNTVNADTLLVKFTALKEGTFTITSSESSDTVVVSAEDVSDSGEKEETITVGFVFDDIVTLSFDGETVASKSARTLAIRAGSFDTTANADGDVEVSFVPLRAGTFVIQAVGGPSVNWTIITTEVGSITPVITLLTGHGFIGDVVISFGGHEYARESISTVPGTPALTAAIPTHNSVVLSWDAQTSATGYTLSRTGGTGSIEIPVTGTEISYTDDTLEPETTYTYSIRTVAAAGDSAASNVVSVTTLAAPTDTTPSLTAERNADNSITLSWSNIESVNNFALYVSKGGTVETPHFTTHSPTAEAEVFVLTILTSNSFFDKINNADRIGVAGAVAVESTYGDITYADVPAQSTDTTPPPVPTITTPSATVGASPITIDGGSTEAGATITLFNGGTSAGTVIADGSGNFSFTGVALDEGTNSFTARASDRVNTSAASPAIVITLDTETPEAPIITTSSATVNTPSITIEGTAEAGTTIELFNGATSVDTVIADTGNFSFTRVALNPGTNSFTATASDEVNTSAASPAIVITLDTEKPVITVLGSSETIELTATDTYTIPDAIVEDNDPAYSGTVTVTDDAPNSSVIGVYTVLYDAPADTAGNTPDQQSITITVSDTTPPTFDVDGNTVDYTTTVPFGGTYAPGAINNQSDISVIVSSIVVGDDLVNVNTSGEYIVTYTVTDSNGQTTTITETVTVGPEPTIDAVRNADNSVTVSWSNIETNLPNEYVLTIGDGSNDFDTFTPTVESNQYTITTTITRIIDLNDANEVCVKGVGVDNKICEPVPEAFDTTVPSITVNEESFSVELGETYTPFTFAATDNTDGVITDDVVVAGYPADTDTIGTYDVTFDVVDAAGNPAVTVTRTVTVTATTPPTLPDTEKPVITPAGSSEIIELTQTNTYTIPDATVEDNDPNYSGTVTVTDDAPNSSVIGVYTVLYDAPDDAAGNTPDQKSITITVSDTTAPTFDVDGHTVDYTTTVPFDGTYTPGVIANESDISGIASSLVGGETVNANTSGEYVVTYTVTDNNGQVTTITETVTVGSDVTAPPVPAITTPPATVNTPSITIEGTAEAGTTVELFNEGSTVDTITADGDGNFSFTEVALDEGENSFTATASDGVNTSDASSPVVITLDTTAVGSIASAPSGTETPKKKGGDSNEWKTKPTFGKHWNNQAVQLVDDGFVFNGMPLTITNNWHTDFDLTSSIIGDDNTVHIKGYATNGLKSVSLSLGVPEIGLKTNAESHIIVNVNSNYTSPAGYDIADIVHEQKEELVNEEMTGATIDKVKCTSSDTAERCFDVTISFVIMAPLSHEVLAINAVDKQRYSTTTYINEGVEFTGEALLAAATHELKQKHGNQNPFETISLTQQDRRYQVWEDQYGYIWSQNDYGTWLQITRPDIQQRDDLPTSVMTRIHSNFANLVIDEQDRATLIFDSKAIQGTLDESFSYDMPLRLDRVSDPALLESLSIQEMLAQEMLCDCMIYDDSDLSWND